MSNPREYADPPVVEALCEVYFDSSRWDDTVPGRFFDRAQTIGFTEKEPVQRHEAQIHLDAVSGPSAVVRQDTRMRFRNADRTRVVQVEPDLVVVNQLRPYPTFADWSPTVVAVARTYAELAEARGVSRIGLRYINRIDLPGSRVDLSEWFLVAPRLPSAWQDTAGSFLVRVERKVAEGMDLILTFGSAPSKVGESSFMLDLYAVHTLRAVSSVESLPPLLEDAHSCIESVFEGSITEALRTRFRAAAKP